MGGDDTWGMCWSELMIDVMRDESLSGTCLVCICLPVDVTSGMGGCCTPFDVTLIVGEFSDLLLLLRSDFVDFLDLLRPAVLESCLRGRDVGLRSAHVNTSM